MEDVDRLGQGGHVGALGHHDGPVLHQGRGVVGVQFVLGGARQRDLARHLPDPPAGDEGRVRTPVGVGRDPQPLDLLDLLQQFDVDAVGVDHVPGRVGRGERQRAQLQRLLDGVDRDIARAGDQHAASLDGFAADAEHLLDEEDRAVAGGLGAHLGAAPTGALAGEHAGFVPVGDLAVLTEEVADLASADADVTGGHVGVLAEVPVQLVHERLAEAHDLAVALAVRVEVGAALAAADALAGQRVLEDLLEAEELDDGAVHRRVEPQAALVRPQHGRELHAVGPLHLHLAGVVHPRHPEDDLPLRLDQPLQDAVLEIVRILGDDRNHRCEHLVDGLMELVVPRVATQHVNVGGTNHLGQRLGGKRVRHR